MKRTCQRRWGTIILLCLLLSLAPPLQGAEKRYTVPLEDSPILGSKDAPVTIIEFIDYQ